MPSRESRATRSPAVARTRSGRTNEPRRAGAGRTSILTTSPAVMSPATAPDRLVNRIATEPTEKRPGLLARTTHEMISGRPPTRSRRRRRVIGLQGGGKDEVDLA